MPIGNVTRGTTGYNRLRRVDRWIAPLPVLRRTDDPLVADVGYGASPTTTLELRDRLAAVRPDVEVTGIEIEPSRVALANAGTRDGVTFRLGGFETPTPGQRRPAVIRAFNVLRQYDESAVVGSWRIMQDRLQPGGALVEGTCNEVGRVASWVTLDDVAPRTFTVSLRLAGLDVPSIVAERLPKALIHRNVPGERVHAFLRDLDLSWAVAAPLGTYGPRQRWIATVRGMRDRGWPVLHGVTRWRLGELSVPWSAVEPA
ncbi:class I SAM-dependent methyltransferase [Curtobacterium flaccumfaciens]|uniref:class I SAM-dependent methyltransferase n=1 Tax=Curtobacterium flaccumfaciens TaxID=2035 RepID=UPI001ADCEF38|nr:class I SAM-dependent methyltransferase [Curtobacterium flaccumfaciens]MBO9041118.1 class I SAM-dependent methyltransferase [Curtobacterium flaccumfaciens pv. flaccumfaciens]